MADPQDPVRACLRSGARIGMLGIDLATRRRNRANGVLNHAGTDGLLVDVGESFGNCPKYIRTRQLVHVERRQGATEAFGAALPSAAVSLIEACETMFVASSSGRETLPSKGGLDISHRGGEAGFVRVQGNVLSVPDYPGNRYFNTLGNLLLEPRASLVMVDFGSGDLLQLQGVADVAWEEGEDEGQAGRSWTFEVARGWLRRAVFPLAGA
jgi:predicted pyridoxine 5'-phosphate oxidase superfamily flavin-nucleotide-binding protein